MADLIDRMREIIERHRVTDSPAANGYSCHSKRLSPWVIQYFFRIDPGSRLLRAKSRGRRRCRRC
jgi:hypothetical protein